MYYLRNILLLITVSGVAPVALAAAPSTENSGVEAIEPNGALTAIFYVQIANDQDSKLTLPDFNIVPNQVNQPEDDDDQDLTGNDGAAVLEQLDARARTKCYTRSRPAKRCSHSDCPGNKQCKVNARGNCVFKLPQRKRPFGCSQCLCYRASG